MKKPTGSVQTLFFASNILAIALSLFFILSNPRQGSRQQKIEQAISDSLILSVISIISFTIGSSVIGLEKYIRERDKLLKNISVLPQENSRDYLAKIIEKVVLIEKNNKNVLLRNNESEHHLREILKTLERIEKNSFPANTIERMEFVSRNLGNSKGDCYALGCEDLLDWWNTESAKEYWRVNQEFLSQKGNYIKRCYIISNSMEDYINGSKKDLLEDLENWYLKQKKLVSFDKENKSYIIICERKFIDSRIYSSDIDPNTSFILVRDKFCTSAKLFSDCYCNCEGGVSYDKDIISEYVGLFSNINKTGKSTKHLKDWIKQMEVKYQREKDNIII